MKPTLKLWNQNAPLVIGHRGASYDAPENTLAAFRLARDLGADAIEFDAKLSRDGVVVIHHDRTLDRTTDGSGPSLRTIVRVAERTRCWDSLSPFVPGRTHPDLGRSSPRGGKRPAS